MRFSTSGLFFTNQFPHGPWVGNLWGPFRIFKKFAEIFATLCYHRWQAVHRCQRHIIASVVLLVPTLLRYFYMLALHREMENINRGPTFGDLVTISTERSMQDVTVARLQSTRLQTPLPFFQCNILRESLSVDRQNFRCATLKSRGSWVISVRISLALHEHFSSYILFLRNMKNGRCPAARRTFSSATKWRSAAASL